MASRRSEQVVVDEDLLKTLGYGMLWISRVEQSHGRTRYVLLHALHTGDVRHAFRQGVLFVNRTRAARRTWRREVMLTGFSDEGNTGKGIFPAEIQWHFFACIQSGRG